MTAWPAAQVAGYARAAGFGKSELAVATAVALAGSGGQDATLEVPPGPTGPVLVGLWLVPSDTVETAFSARLFDPQLNANTAHGLWVDAGGSWEWSTVWRAGGWRSRLTEATEAVGRRGEPASLAGIELDPADTIPPGTLDQHTAAIAAGRSGLDRATHEGR